MSLSAIQYVFDINNISRHSDFGNAHFRVNAKDHDLQLSELWHIFVFSRGWIVFSELGMPFRFAPGIAWSYQSTRAEAAPTKQTEAVAPPKSAAL
jgi:hypothetical protein